MATQPRTIGLTYDDLVEMFPEEDDVRREIIDGQLFVTPSPTARHQDVVWEIGVSLRLWTKRHGGKAFGSPLDTVLSPDSVVQPDVLLIREDNVGRIGERLRGAPDLVVEVSSASTRPRDLGRKRELYERFGVAEYWFVDLDEDAIDVHRLRGNRYGPPIRLSPGDRLESPLLPGFSASVGELLHPR